MKSFKHIFTRKTFAAGLAASMLMISCTKDFERLNTNPYGVSEDDLKRDFQYIGEPFKQIQMSIFAVNPSWVFQVQQNLMGDLYSGYMAVPNPFGNFGNNNTTYNLQDGWNQVLWGCAYGSYAPSLDNSVMPVCRYVGNLTKEEYPNFYAWSQILKVFTMHRLADVYGPIIYTKYGQLNADGSVDYDSQQEAYNAFFTDLSEAIATLTKYHNDNAPKNFAEFDLSPYQGDYAKWVQAANTLRLRLAIRISKADPQKARTEGEAALAHPLGLLTTAADNFTINIAPLEHPLRTFSEGWNDIRMSAPMEAILTGLKDPRLEKYFMPSEEYAGEYKGIRNGIDLPAKEVYVNFSRLNRELLGNSRVQVMTAAEAWFLRAEAGLLGWAGAGDAKGNYEKGVETSFSQHGVSGKFAEYIADNVSKAAPYVDPKNAANNIGAGSPWLSTITIKWDDADSPARKLERIITQKWIAGFPEGQEAWAEFRRTGYPKQFPVMINNSGGKISTTAFIRRINFSSTEYQSNPKGVERAVTLLGGPDNGGTRLWWDKP